MFIHLAIHRPRPEKAGDLLASMRRVEAAAAGNPGLVDINICRDARSGALVGLARWETRADFEAAHPLIFEAVKDDPFEDWEDNPPQVLHLEIID